MKKIASFTINHLTLEPGVYVSRRDTTPSGDVLTTLDLRMTAPNREAALSPQALHTIEHLAATWLRNNAEWGSRTSGAERVKSALLNNLEPQRIMLNG